MLEVAERPPLGSFGVGLQSDGEISRQVGDLSGGRVTPGLDVVWLPKVEPVGGRVGGYLDL